MESIMGMWRTVIGSMNANCLPDRSILKRARKCAPAPATASNGKPTDEALCRWIQASEFKLLMGRERRITRRAERGRGSWTWIREKLHSRHPLQNDGWAPGCSLPVLPP